jgi:hypothetical protein
MRKLILMITAIISLGCNAQSKSALKTKTANLKKLDMEKYVAGGVNKGIHRLALNDTIYQLISDETTYKEIIHKKGDLIRKELIYDKPQKFLFIEHAYFSGCRIGISHYYDEEGNQIGEFDNDVNFRLSANEIVKKLEDKLGVKFDYNHPDRWNITRAYDPKFKSSKYFTVVYVDQYKKQYRYIEIDGNTGEIIKDTIAFLEE